MGGGDDHFSQTVSEMMEAATEAARVCSELKDGTRLLHEQTVQQKMQARYLAWWINKARTTNTKTTAQVIGEGAIRRMLNRKL